MDEAKFGGAIKNPPRFHIQLGQGEMRSLAVGRNGIYRLSEIYQGSLTELCPDVYHQRKEMPAVHLSGATTPRYRL